MKDLLEHILSNPYHDYMYSYPHKKAYREFAEPISFNKLWEKANRTTITLYIHIPFCRNKCGYCNLFSSTCFDQELMNNYADKVIAEIKGINGWLSAEAQGRGIGNVIFGGGTPTILPEGAFANILEAIKSALGIDFRQIFFSTEISPSTITASQIELFEKYHVKRISVGVQSFVPAELAAIHRRDYPEDIDRAFKMLTNIPIRNLDLIYGIPGQTLQSWKTTLVRSLDYNPEELYIYPIYIREKTGLYTQHTRDNALMLRMYEMAAELLQEHNYTQTSMRNFIRQDVRQELFPEYSCQENEMIGIGCGARSYVGNVHYSRQYAVEPCNIQKIIQNYLQETKFDVARYGYILNSDELKRRYILKSILKVSGLDQNDYAVKFETPPLKEFPELKFLVENGFLALQENWLRPTPQGLMYSDAIGQLLISKTVWQKIHSFDESRPGKN